MYVEGTDALQHDTPERYERVSYARSGYTTIDASNVTHTVVSDVTRTVGRGGQGAMAGGLPLHRMGRGFPPLHMR